MYGDLGNKLVSTLTLSSLKVNANTSSQVQHAKRTQNLTHLPPYQTELVRNVTAEVRDLNKYSESVMGDGFDLNADPATSCALFVTHMAMRRNKRCLLAYHRTRTDKLEELVWSGSDIADLAGQQQPHRTAAGGAAAGSASGMNGGNGASSSLSPQEEEYMRQYSDLLAAYKGQWTDIDLTGSLEPPRDLFIDVRVLKDAGEIQTEYG
jgi:GINS complex subunit 1